MGNIGVAPRILNLGVRWTCVVSFTCRPLYSPPVQPVAYYINSHGLPIKETNCQYGLSLLKMNINRQPKRRINNTL